ncbi:MAG TPA: helix-turn-helix transcriptional regulator [Thermoanaerobaculia bacterium]|nr:helix-turn-helix transcriptional regulator [Thermoanaerobaculia bacterium]
METSEDPRDFAAVIVFLRRLRGWAQADLAQAAGVSASSLCEYELGKVAPSPRTRQRLAAALGLPLSALHVEAAHARGIRRLMEPAGRLPATGAEPGVGESAAGAALAAEGLATSVVAAYLAELAADPGSDRPPAGPPAAEDRLQAPPLWARLSGYAHGDRLFLVEVGGEFRSWALCELLCAESVKVAADQPGPAVELAELALRIARLVPGGKAWRSRLGGYAGGHLGNARRVSGDLPAADECFHTARRLWRAGAAVPALLDPSRLPDLEASLRREQRRQQEALALLQEAAATCPTAEGVARILINKAKTLEELGDCEGAIATLRDAAPLVEKQADPHLLFALRFNLLVNLCFLGRHAEAEPMLPEVRELAARLGNDLDSVRLRWLEGRIAAGLGRTEEALAALGEVREAFIARGIAYDAALVTLELAVLLADLGRTREVKRLARETAPIFKAQGVRREALATLKLFCQAAQKETLTAALARKFLADLRRA